MRGLRQRLNLTQECYAENVGVPYSTLIRRENGKRVPLPLHAKRLVELKDELDSQVTNPPGEKTSR